jgi:hypothetical protein
MRRKIVSLRIIESIDAVGMSHLYHGSMEEISVALPLFELLNVIFLVPYNLFFLIALINLGSNILLLMG